MGRSRPVIVRRLEGATTIVPPSRRRGITGHVPSSVCREPDIDLQLADPGSKFVGDDLVDVSTPVCHQVGDRHGCWQPDEVLHALILILAEYSVMYVVCITEIRLSRIML